MKVITVTGSGPRGRLSELLRESIPGSIAFRFPAVSGGEPGASDAESRSLLPADGEDGTSGVFPPAVSARDTPDTGSITRESVVIVDTVAVEPGPEPLLAVFLMDAPLEMLPEEVRECGTGADLVLVEVGPVFGAEGEKGLERLVKEATGAGKVLICDSDEGRERAFGKVLDAALSRLGEVYMPEDIPEELIDAVKREAVDNRMTCEAAHLLAEKMGVPVPLVGRALDLLEVKITRCRLGCF